MGKIMLNGEMFGVEVEANPTVPAGTTPTDLSKLKIDKNYFNISGGSGGSNVIKYLKSSGTQYIDTGIKGNENLSFELEFFLDFDQIGAAASWQIPVGGNDGNTINSVMVGFNQSSLTMTYQMGSLYGDKTGIFMQPRDIHKITNIHGFYGFDKQSMFQWTPSAFTSGHNIFLFGSNTNGTAEQFASICLVDFKIWNNNTLAMHLIPAKDTNNVACLYDEVSHNYFYNAGTGSFSYGER